MAIAAARIYAGLGYENLCAVYTKFTRDVSQPLVGLCFLAASIGTIMLVRRANGILASQIANGRTDCWGLYSRRKSPRRAAGRAPGSSARPYHSSGKGVLSKIDLAPIVFGAVQTPAHGAR